MSYTDYPRQAKEFSDGCEKVKSNIDDTIVKLKDKNNILLSCQSKDLIVTRSSEALNDIAKRMEYQKIKIDDDVEKTNKLANEWENEAMIKALANQEGNGD